MQELLAINPELSMSRLLLAFPLKNPEQRAALIEALGALGLPGQNRIHKLETNNAGEGRTTEGPRQRPPPTIG